MYFGDYQEATLSFCNQFWFNCVWVCFFVNNMGKIAEVLKEFKK